MATIISRCLKITPEFLILLFLFIANNLLAEETVYEAEAAITSEVPAENHPGYTGSGFIDYIGDGYIEWQITAAESAHFDLGFRYALKNSDRPLRIIVDGQQVNASLSFPATGAWRNWSTAHILLPLVAGNHTVRAETTGFSGANMDSLIVSKKALGDTLVYEAESALTSETIDTKHGGYTGSGFIDYIDDGYIEWSVDVLEPRQYELGFRYALKQGNRPLNITVDGQAAQSSLSFPATGSWTTWSVVSTSFFLSAGTHTIRAETNDVSGANMDSLLLTPTETNSNQAPQVSIDMPVDGSSFTDAELIAFHGSAGDAEDGDLSSSIQWSSDQDGILGSGADLITNLSAGNHLVSATVTDSQSELAMASVSLTISDTNPDPDPDLPPDPITVAPLLDSTQVTSMKTATEFLYTGTMPIQTGVNADDIEAKRVAILRGKVLQRDNTVLTGVAITIKDHPEFGQTLSRGDGFFDMAVNGGGLLTLIYQKDGYLSVQRQVKTPWRDYAHPSDVVMIPVDSQVTNVDLSSSQAVQVAQGSMQTDTDGERQATIFFPQGTSATMTLPSGATQALTSINVRATEYTVGDNGPATMPGELPPASGYTYAVELSVDEALAMDANRVDFSQAIPIYVDNFLNFPIGEKVPAGWYDQDQSAWIPSPNGRVIGILSISNGLADLDLNGAGVAADATALAALGIDDAERTQLAQTYSVGKTLWRVPVTHFTPWDFNWPYGPPEGAVAPPNEGPKTLGENKPESEDTNPCVGCIIEAQSQTLGEEVPIVGSPFMLHYRSDRVIGRKTGNLIKIPLSLDTVPSSLLEIELTVDFAGRRFRQTFPAIAEQTTMFEWDGLDSYGRPLNDTQARVTVAYVYKLVYYSAEADFIASFSQHPDDTFSLGERGTETIKIEKKWSVEMQSANLLPVAAGLGSWTLTPHQAYDIKNRILYGGDGSWRSTANIGVLGNNVITTIAGNGNGGFSGDGGDATLAEFTHIYDIEFGPDGSLYIADEFNNRIRKVSPDGIVSTVAGNGTENYNGDGILATEASLSRPKAIALSSDGVLYIADEGHNRIRRVGLDGIISTVAGNGRVGAHQDGIPAIEARIDPYDVAVGNDGSIYTVEDKLLRRIGLDGIITTITGDGINQGPSGDGGDAVFASASPSSLKITSRDEIYFRQTGFSSIRKIGVGGIINTIAGGQYAVGDDGGPAVAARVSGGGDMSITPDGDLYFAESSLERVRRIDRNGVISTVVGTGVRGFSGDGGAAEDARLSIPRDVEVGPDGSLYIADSGNRRIRRVTQLTSNVAEENKLIASHNGRVFYVFSAEGKHLETRDSINGAILLTFTYTSGGFLSTVTDQDNRITTIERDSLGNPLAIIAPDGQLTTLGQDTNGYLTRVSDPEGNAFNFTYSSDGLMTERTDPRLNNNIFQYDSLGRLQQDDDPEGGGWKISRADSTVDDSYTVSMASGENRVRSFTVKPLSTGDRQHTNTAPDGSQTTILFGRDGSEVTTSADGTVSVLTESPDPRFGMMSPVKSLSITTPGGLLNTLSSTRAATLEDEADFLSHTALNETISINGKTYSSVYDTATRTWSDTSAEGRFITRVLDSRGRLSQHQVTNLAPVDFYYNAEGRLASILQDDGNASRTLLMNYYSSGSQQGFLQSVIDAEMRQTSFAYDDAGRVTQQTLPDGRQIDYTYDSSGNLSSLRPPGSSTHSFNYTAVDLESHYIPPNLSDILNPETRYDYNKDKQLELIIRPDGQTVDYVYNATTGKLTQTVIPQGSYAYSYSGATGQLTQITAPNSGTLNYAYDGSLLLSSTWGGNVSGEVSQTYNNDFQQVQGCANSDCIDFAYDDDLLLIQAGKLAINRDAQKGGLITSTAINNINTARTYNPFGELDTVAANDGSSVLYSADYSRDNLGRITQQVETVLSTTTTYDYRYDLAGRLEEIDTNGISTATYGYDSNSNRTLVNGVPSGIFDAQDRLTDHNNTSYTYTVNGELQTKLDTVTNETTTYLYDVLGNLRQITLPDSTQIDYDIDGQNRRIGKRINGVLSQAFLYKDQLNPVAELEASGAIVSRFVYGSKINVPDYMVKGGATYRIISNHLGSPRLVVDTSSGNVVQRIDYNEWGEITSDSNPGFQPFGFAGGLYDQDTKLTRFGARDYDAEIGRWAAKDPIKFIGLDTNLYGYTFLDPVNYIDPDGRIGLAGAAVGGVIGGVSAFTGSLATGASIGDSAIAGGLGAVFGAATGFLGGVGVGASSAIGGLSNATAQIVGNNLDSNTCNNGNINLGSVLGSAVGGGWASAITKGAGAVTGAVVGWGPSTASGAIGTALSQ